LTLLSILAAIDDDDEKIRRNDINIVRAMKSTIERAVINEEIGWKNHLQKRNYKLPIVRLKIEKLLPKNLNILFVH
jgi:hypothetical protein